MSNPLEFVGGRNPRILGNLDEIDIRQVPIEPGAYVLIAVKGQFKYLGGMSSVFYIGKASKLRQRLRRHKRKFKEATNKNRSHPIYRPVTEYAAEYGAIVAVLQADEETCERELEFLLLAEFVAKFRGLPIANHAVNWRKVREYLKKLKLLTAE